MANKYAHISRSRKIRAICQAHLAPGMTLIKWRQIIDRHGVENWEPVPDGQIDAIFDEIAGIVAEAKAAGGVS